MEKARRQLQQSMEAEIERRVAQRLAGPKPAGETTQVEELPDHSKPFAHDNKSRFRRLQPVCSVPAPEHLRPDVGAPAKPLRPRSEIARGEPVVRKAGLAGTQ